MLSYILITDFLAMIPMSVEVYDIIENIHVNINLYIKNYYL